MVKYSKKMETDVSKPTRIACRPGSGLNLVQSYKTDLFKSPKLLTSKNIAGHEWDYILV